MHAVTGRELLDALGLVRAISPVECLVSTNFLQSSVLNAFLNAFKLGVEDEYWQGPEVAHAWRYQGHFTWEWERCVALRGVLHPGIFLLLLQILPEYPLLLAYAPRLLQGFLASTADLAVYRTAERLGGYALARWAVSVQLASWFQLYALPRTMIFI